MELELRDQYQSLDRPDYSIFLFPTKTDKKMYKITMPWDVRWKESLKVFHTQCHFDFSATVIKLHDMILDDAIVNMFKLNTSTQQFYGHVEQGAHALLNLHAARFDGDKDIALRCNLEKLRILTALLYVAPRVLPKFTMLPYEMIQKVLTIIEEEQL